jgi:hypothetical protein
VQLILGDFTSIHAKPAPLWKGPGMSVKREVEGGISQDRECLVGWEGVSVGGMEKVPWFVGWVTMTLMTTHIYNNDSLAQGCREGIKSSLNKMKLVRIVTNQLQ